MANSFLTSLDTLDPNSVTNISSLFFWVSNNNNSRLISGTNLQSWIGKPQTTILNKTTVQTMDGSAVNSPIVWDEAVRDPYGMWSAASATIVNIPFNGWVQFRYRLESATGGGTFSATRVCTGTGTATFPGCAYILQQDLVTAYQDTGITAPVSVTAGNVFQLIARYQAVNQLDANNMSCWLEVIPLKIYT